MLDILSEANTTGLIGLLGGIALGLAARLGRFCTLGAIEDFIYSSDNRRMRMWGVAIAVAMIGVHIAIALGLFDVSETVYLNRAWNPIATIVGGLMFGYGMALTGTCGYGALARLGGGDLRSLFVVIIMGLSAYIVLSGPLAHFRVWLFPVDSNTTSSQSFNMLSGVLGAHPSFIGILLGIAILIFSLASRRMLASLQSIFWGVVVGLAIVFGWLGTYWVAMTGFDAKPVQSFSFVEPVGDTIFYSMTASGNSLSFGVGSVFGVIIGAVLGCYQKGRFRWEACDDPRELKRQILGATLMGPGAILAVGCSIGQGISAFSVLAYSAPVTFIAIFCGAAFGLRQLITGFYNIE